MKRIAALALALCAVVGSASAQSQPNPQPIVRIAEIDIDPAQLPAYLEALRVEMETSVRIEPGVKAIYAVAEEGRPSRLRFFEIYADEEAYRRHLASPHFQRYAEVTKDMILSKKLIETQPFLLATTSLPR